MKAIVGLFVLAQVVLSLGLMMLTFYGLVLALKASLVLFVIVLLLEPSPLVLGILALIGHPEVAKSIATWLHLA